jgi:hypothetical protein
MSSSLADLTSRPIQLRVEVKDDRGEPTGEILEYLVHPLSFGEDGELQRWIDSCFPDPYAKAWDAIQRQRDKGKPFNTAQEKHILSDAARLAMQPRHMIGTPEADELLMSIEGLKRVVLHGIRKGDPTFDEEKAERLVKHMDMVDIVKTYVATQVNMLISDPKAEPLDVKPTRRPNGSSTSRRTRRAQAKASRTGGGSSGG